VSKFTLVVDSSQISSFLECPQKWINYYVKRLEPLGFQPDEDAMDAGTYGHRLLDIFYRLKSKGVGLNDSVKSMNDYDPDSDMCECGCSKDFHCPLTLAPGVIECKRCKKCTKFRAHPFNLNTKSRTKVRNRVRDYLYKYQQDDFQPLSEQHVEIGFSEPIYEDSDNLFILEGRIDLLAKLQGLDCLVDHKFQMKTHWLYMRSIQIKNYMLISKMPMAVINYIRLQDKLQPDSLVREIVTLNSVELATWHKRLIQVFFRMKKVLQAAQKDSNQAERNWNSCSGGRLTYDKDKPNYCWFTPLCEEIDPAIAEAKEKQLFKIKEAIWRPW
jgi:hypothetical protein